MNNQNNTVWVSGVKDINTIRGALGVSFGKDDDYPTSATLQFKTHKTDEEREREGIRCCRVANIKDDFCI